MHTLESAAPVTHSGSIPANVFLKLARKHGHVCRMNVRATLRDVASAVTAGRIALVQCVDRRNIFVVQKIEDGLIHLSDARSGEETALSIAQFGLVWHGNHESRTGRLMTVAPESL